MHCIFKLLIITYDNVACWSVSLTDDLRDFVLSFLLGIGRTTLVRHIVQQLKETGVPLNGFYTEEVRGHHGRIGFDVVTLDGQRAPLARVAQ